MTANISHGVLLVVALCVVLWTSQVHAQSSSSFHGEGWIVESESGPAVLALTGTAGGIGKYSCSGELVLVTDESGHNVGTGVAVFTAQNGDQLAGVVTITSGPAGGGDISFSWQNSVMFSNGIVVPTSGRFIKNRPPGATNKFQGSPFGGPNGIIAILIG